MSAFSDEMAALALELLTEFGEAVSFVRTTEGAYDPATATTGSATTSNFSGFGAPINYDGFDIDGTVIRQSDIKLFVNAVSTLPITGDAVTVDSVVYRVMNTRRYAINSEDVLYELQLRV